jgi:hypothetical protein
MDNKLQELTDKLYREGLSKGKEEGETILAKAKEQAAEIIAEAKKEAEAIVKGAQKEADDFKTKIEGDVKMAAVQSIQATRKDIENLLVSKMTDSQVTSALSSADFVKEAIKAVTTRFNAEQAMDLDVVLPESLRSELEPFIKGELSKLLKGGIEAHSQRRLPEASL